MSKQPAKILNTLKDVYIMLYNKRGFSSWICWNGIGRCHHNSLLPILLAKREKRNSLIISLKYPEQNKLKRKVVNSVSFRSVI